ncbi:tetratricopeptide repeat-containing protein [Lactococcus chungangensis]|uniref:tetratricopeptide repeat-containing protein n=1 Tax=Pseudolactococcus chungangensis TaxID=451457 RepID=UPI0028D7A1F2|nr:tetratricopeptide repeat-containing protein [Lactococcus chungangensis]
MNQKVCFVAMGFGKKMDYQNSKEVDLDRIYTNVIKPLFEEEFSGYKLIRADEISGSSVIDVSMYALLLNADLVIADITTLNPNAIYELGVRHAVRPFSTIIMAQADSKIPFDLSHSRYLMYDEIGEVLDECEANKIKDALKGFIDTSEYGAVDSPMYTYLPETEPPKISDQEYNRLIKKAEASNDTITKLLTKAKESMRKSDFRTAIASWKNLKKVLPNNDYVVQQLALSTYKSKHPNETKALEKALELIKELNPEKSLDLETLGITGAIYKNLYRLNNNFDYLDDAIENYRKGFIIKQDYYNGENYANCLAMKTQKSDITEKDREYLIYESKKAYSDVISIIKSSLDDGEENYWMYATLSIAYFYLGDEEKYLQYQRDFYNETDVEWEKNSYKKTLEEIGLLNSQQHI